MSRPDLSIAMRLMDDQVRFEATARDNAAVTLDYFPPFGEGKGYTSMELLLISAASCLATTLVTMLRGRTQRTISAVRATADGMVREAHPKSFSHIEIVVELDSPDAEEAEVARAFKVAEEWICPVLAMLRGNVEVHSRFVLNRGGD
ncbi:MAG: OsmC family protein [Clostridiales bacterium]|nr:OsmC family protein [Clostridiales bacterium]